MSRVERAYCGRPPIIPGADPWPGDEAAPAPSPGAGGADDGLPQWGEAYQLFDGTYASLDDLCGRFEG